MFSLYCINSVRFCKILYNNYKIGHFRYIIFLVSDFVLLYSIYTKRDTFIKLLLFRIFY